MPVIALLLLLLAAPAWAQDRLQPQPQKPPDAVELDVANHWQALDLANKNLAAALGRLVEDRRKLKEELEAQKELSKQPKVSEAPK